MTARYRLTPLISLNRFFDMPSIAGSIAIWRGGKVMGGGNRRKSGRLVDPKGMVCVLNGLIKIARSQAMALKPFLGFK
jgi:hypothetical protein